MKTRSLTRRTVSLVLATQIACAMVLSGAALLHERNTRFRAFDTRVQGRSDSLLGAIQDAEDRDANVTVDPAELSIPAEDVYAVYNQGGRLLGTSPHPPGRLIARAQDGFRTVRADGTRYRVLQREALRVIDRAEYKGVGLRRPVTILYAIPEGHLWHEILEAANFYLITIALVALGAAFFVSLMLRRSLQPLSELAAAASNVSAPALEFAAPRSALQVKELRPLADVLSDVVARLRESFAKQHRFVGDAAHELKTVIAVIRSSVQLLMLRRRSVEEYGAGLERVYEDTQRMEALVGQMLQLARLEEHPAGDMQHVDLSRVVTSVVEKLSPVSLTCGVWVDVHTAADLFVRVPAASAEVLVTNLLHNALQHSKRESRIAVSVQRHAPDCAWLEVTDWGEGIGPEALPHIFERFYREDDSRSRQTGGAGLGLAICKSIVDAAGGSIQLASTKDVGTRARVTLPLVESPYEAVDSAPGANR